MKLTARDVFTPANAITLAGLILTILGCFSLNRPSGFVLVIIGRLLDLVDGPVARATRMTRFSIYFDPTADKIALLAIIISVLHFDLAPTIIVLYILLQNAIVAALSIIAQRRRVAVGALIPGKLNLFFQTGAIVLFIGSHLMYGAYSPVLNVLAYIAFAISLPLAVIATIAYAKLLK